MFALIVLFFIVWFIGNIALFCLYFEQSDRMITNLRSDFDTQGVSFAQISIMVGACLAVMLAYIKWWVTYTDVVTRFTKWITTPRVKKNP